MLCQKKQATTGGPYKEPGTQTVHETCVNMVLGNCNYVPLLLTIRNCSLNSKAEGHCCITWSGRTQRFHRGTFHHTALYANLFSLIYFHGYKRGGGMVTEGGR